MTRPSLFGPIIAYLVMFSSAAQPFGADGHRIIAKIAENHLSDKTAQAVGEITASEELAKISLWPDRIRHLSGWKQSKYWHYINIDDNEQLSNFRRDEDGDVISALEHFIPSYKTHNLIANNVERLWPFLATLSAIFISHSMWDDGMIVAATISPSNGWIAQSPPTCIKSGTG